MLNSPLFTNTQNTEENLAKLGRVACIKMDNVLDALAILTKAISLKLPLNNGTNDEPYVYPSNGLAEFINDYDSNKTQVAFHTAGKYLFLL